MSLSNNYPALAPNLLLDFANSKVIDSRIGVTRASTATYFDQLGVLQTAQNNVPRIDFNPTTYACNGLLVEEARTNSIRNNTMQGAVAGTPGTLPTNWSTFTSLTGITTSVVGTGAESGITYIDVRLSGTPSAAGTYAFYTETTTGVAALSGQTWTVSQYIKLQGGSLTGISAFRLYFQENNSGGSYLIEQNITVSNPTSAALSSQRVSATRTLNQATTAFVMPGFNVILTGVAIDITLRIGLPQLELGAFATSVIPTTTTALTRQADAISMTGTNFSSWYNAMEGTLLTQGILEGGTSGTFPRQAAIVGSNANNDSISIYWNAASGTMVGNVRTSGVDQGNVVAGGAKSAGSAFKTIIAYQQNNTNFASDGSIGVADTSVTLPAVQSLLIGGPSVFQPYASSWIQRISYYPLRNTNAQLQALTGT